MNPTPSGTTGYFGKPSGTAMPEPNQYTRELGGLPSPNASTTAGDKPSYQNQAYGCMAKYWAIVGDVYAGTLRMREKKDTYLPKFPLESQAAYDDRVKKLTLMNAYARTVDAMVGLVVGSGIKVDNLPQEIEGHVKNIDNAGTEFQVFSREVLREAFNGHCGILIDMPFVPDEEKPRNRLEQKRSKLRPYWTRRKPEDIWNWRSETIQGETVLTQITFRECVIVADGEFGEKEEVRFYTWRLNVDETGNRVASWAKYQESTDDKGNKVYILINSGTTHLTRIPFVVIYGYQEDGKILESRPPLMDLALKNIEHMQIDSDYKKGLSIAGIAIPVVKTEKAPEEIAKTVGWDQLMVVGAEEDFEWKEANGNALPNKRTALEDIKREMGVLGLSLIAERADTNITATERLLDSVQQSNQLMAIQASLVQGLRLAYEIHADWMKLDVSASDDPNQDKGIKVAIGLNWTEIVRSADHMQLLLEMAKEDLLSVATLLESAVKYGVLPSWIDPKEEVGRLESENRVRQSNLMMKATQGGIQVGPDGQPKAASDNLNTQSVKDPKMSTSGGSKGDNLNMTVSTSLKNSDKSREN